MDRIAALIAQAPARIAQYPDAWDWRAVDGVDWTTSIRDQDACGACVAFGVVAVIESMLMLHDSDPALQPDLSEAHLFFCGCGDCCDRGWWPTYALNYAKGSGVPDEACFPYRDHDMPCSDSCSEWPDRAVKVTNWSEVIDVGARKEWLATHGPLVGCMAVYQDFFSYVGGVYRHTQGELAGYHSVGVVGYSEIEQAWICKNSWGADWGDAGWFLIGYGEAGMDTQFAMYGVEDVIPASEQPPEPEPGPGCNTLARLAGAIRGFGQG
jgi:C1A family cysteine protease